MLTGKIKKVMDGAGYGFIQCDENGLEYFFHFSMLTRKPRIGESVKFEPSDRTEKGPRAQSVEYLR